MSVLPWAEVLGAAFASTAMGTVMSRNAARNITVQVTDRLWGQATEWGVHLSSPGRYT